MPNMVDLKRLIQLINDQKDMEMHLNLDNGCVISADDQTPLIKVINYFLNFLHQLAERPLEISLDLMSDSVLLSMVAFSEKTEMGELSNNLKDALLAYKASYSVDFEPGKYIQVKISFSK